ncbi:MAG: DUF389 domain-containing protein [Acidimicrobiales bacterium]
MTDADVQRMRSQLFFEGPDVKRKLSRYWLLLLLSAVIASAGVVGDSTATVIGAMIVAPLMVPILGTVLGVVLADRDNLLRCIGLVAAGAAAVVAIAWVLGLLVHVPIDAADNSQVAQRVSPHLIDLLAALATGAVGSVALARDDISDTLPGVAIAISLVPPLAVVGLTLESGYSDQALGALLLFVTNVSAILATGLIVMAIYRVNRRVTVDPSGTLKPVHRRRATTVIVASLLVITVPLTFTSVAINRTTSTESTVTRVADTWAAAQSWDIASVTTRPDGVLIRATGPLPEPDTDNLRAALADAGVDGTTVRIELVPNHTVEVTPK